MNALLEACMIPAQPRIQRLPPRIDFNLVRPVAHSPKFLVGKHVLVVDDDKAFLLAITMVFQQLGARVLSAASAQEAIHLLADGAGPLHLVLTDMKMPMVSGKFVLSAMRGSTRHVPVIVMTAYSTPLMRTECTLLGAKALIEKPFGIAEMVTLIKSVMDDESDSLL